jgi:transcriptional regulator with GAF, ATPase, and Fis domain
MATSALSPEEQALLAALPALRSLAAVEEASRALELRALQAALEASSWLPARAARLLGVGRRSSLARALGRHPELAAEVARRRAGAQESTR